MHYSILNRVDLGTISTHLRALMDEDSSTRNVANLVKVSGTQLIDQVWWSTGQTPAHWIRWDGVDLQVYCGGANTVQNGLDLLGGALIPGLPIGQANVNAAALIQMKIISARVDALVPQFPSSVLAAGHSYGGAIMQCLMALWLQRTRGPNYSLYTQGCPRVGDIKLSVILDSCQKIRIMNFGDPIPFFPPHFSEAPFATIALGFIQAQNLSYWAHSGGGAVLDNAGNLTGAELPPISLLINDLSLLSWATGANAFLSSEHSYITYQTRLTKVVAGVQAPPVDPTAGGFKGELALPLTPADLAAGPIAGPLLQERGANVAFQSVFIPVAHRWRPFRVGQVWWATWEGLQIIACQSHSQAKSICKAGNKQLKVIQNASSVSKGAFQNALTTYLVAAGSSTAGFMPVLTVLP